MPPDPRDVLTRPAPPPTRTERFGPAPHQLYDVYSPQDVAAGPLVVLVHGGFWRSGYQRLHLRPLASALARDGFTVVLPEYRGTGEDGGDWRVTPDDVRAAMQAVTEREDPSLGPFVVAGHSAGGHLAVWLLHQPESVDLAGAVSLAGCLDLTMADDLGLGDGAVRDLLGGDPAADPERLSAIDPVALGPTQVPVLLLHGEDDDRVPVALSRSWLDRAGTPARDRLTVLPACEHFGLIDPEHGAYAEVVAALSELAGRTG